jgi:hypothetical protein
MASFAQSEHGLSENSDLLLLCRNHNAQLTASPAKSAIQARANRSLSVRWA